MTRTLETVKTFFKNLWVKNPIDTPHQTDTIPETAARKKISVDTLEIV
jgi:hypothetical protein